MLTIYKASAGSGKTFTLTLEYIKLILGIKDCSNNKYYLNNREYLKLVNHNIPTETHRHRHVLAITFTNKATEEMKTRIINELVAIGQSTEAEKKTPYVDELQKIFEGSTVDMLSETAKKALKELLVDFDNFNVSTIDSFFQQVLRSLAFELDYPGNYEVVINTDPVTTQAVDMMLDDLNYNPDGKSNSQLKGVLKTYMRDQYQQGKGFNLFNRNSLIHDTIVKNVGTLFNEKYQLIANSFEDWRKANPDAIKNFGMQLKAWQKELVDQIIADANRILSSLDSNFSDGEIDRKFRPFVERFAGDPQKYVAYAKTENGKNTIAKARAGEKKILNKKADNPHNQGIAAAYNDMLRTMIERYAHYMDADTLHSEISTYSFMRYTNTFIERIRTDNNIVVLADTNELLHRVMQDSSELPFIYEKMGINLHNFLIDEFQDTSQLQWQNLRELVFNGVAENNDSLIIGDEKQAIYRFRNSDSSMLHSTVAQEMNERHQNTNNKFSDTNWRSAAEVVKFNNTFFARMAQFHNIAGYETAPQLIADKNTELKGYVHFFNTKKLEDELAQQQEEAVIDEDAEQQEDDDVCVQLELMIGEIRRQVENGYHYSDIAVLCNTKDQGAQAVERLLKENMPVITDEALLLNNCQTIRTVVSILQLVVNAKERKLTENSDFSAEEPEHKYKSFASEQAGKFEFEYVKNLQLGKSKEDAINDAIDATFDDNHTSALDDVAEIAAANPSTLYMLVETIINKRIADEQRLRDMPYIAAFQDLVTEYTRNYSNNVVAFLKWWNSIKAKVSINSAEDVDAIKVMTIHKSKGLEFDCVHIPFASWILAGSSRFRESVWVDTNKIAKKYNLPDYLKAAMPPFARITLSPTTGSDDSIFKEYYDENMMAREIDGFNKTYVAYTRAVRELCVYYNEDDNDGKGFGVDIKMVGGLPDYNPAGNRFNPEINIKLEDCINADGDIVVGEPTHPKAKKEVETKPQPIDENSETAQMLNVLFSKYDTFFDNPGKCITSVEPLLDEQPDDLDDDELALKIDNAAMRGDRLHFMLSRINRTSDLPRVFSHTRAMFRNDELCDEAESTIKHFFDAPETAEYVKRWFEGFDHAINEMTIYDPEAPGSEQNVQRPDRIVWNTDGSIDIIDYKFAVKNADHSTQVRRYMNLLQRMYPNATIRGYLWYTDMTHKHAPHVDQV